MSVSSGPYRNDIPFVSVQQILLDAPETERALNITLRVSNEVTKVPRQVEFGNVIYFTSNPQTALLASVSANALTELITSDVRDTIKQSYLLANKDFEYKAPVDPAKRQYVYHNISERTFKLQDVPNLYAVVASYREYKGRITLGNACSHAIVVDGRPPLSANLYRLAETVEGYGTQGSIWPGQVHRHEDKIMVGAFHTEQNHPSVVAEQVQNIKIKDYRVLTAAANLSLASTPVLEPSPLFSPGFISRNAEGIVHGNFSFDRLRYAQEHTRFGQTIKNQEALLSCLKIDDVRIYRKRINSAGTGNSLTPVGLSCCGIQETNDYVQVASLGNGVEIVNTAFSTDEILAMTFVDSDAARFNTGVLQYKVEVVATDLTIEAMTNIQTRLASAASKVLPLRIDGWSDLIDEYLTDVQFIWGAVATRVYSLYTWKKNLLALVAPANNNRADRERVLETIKGTIALINEAVAPGVSISDRPFNVRSKIDNVTREPVIRTNTVLETKYVLTNRQNVGLDYLDEMISRNTSATPAISYADMTSRVDSEITKYSVTSPNSVSSNKYGYLSPASVNLGEENLPTATLELEQDAFLPLLVSTVSDSGQVASINQNSVSTNRRDLLQHAGIGLGNIGASLASLVRNPDSVIPATINAEKYLSTGSPFNKDDAFKRSSISGSEVSIVQAPTAQDRIYDSNIADRLVGASVLGFQAPSLINASSITGSMALKRATQVQDTNANLNGISNTINFDSLTRIEYLHSYDATLRARKPMWKQLDATTFEKIQSSNGTILCRLVRVTNTLEGSALINLEPLGSLFIIGRPQTESAPEGYKSVLARLVRSTRRVASTGVAIVEANQVEIYYSKDMKINPTSLTTTDLGYITSNSEATSLTTTDLGYITSNSEARMSTGRRSITRSTRTRGTGY